MFFVLTLLDLPIGFSFSELNLSTKVSLEISPKVSDRFASDFTSNKFELFSTSFSFLSTSVVSFVYVTGTLAVKLIQNY